MYFFTSYFFQPLGLNNNLGILITIILFINRIIFSIKKFSSYLEDKKKIIKDPTGLRKKTNRKKHMREFLTFFSFFKLFPVQFQDDRLEFDYGCIVEISIYLMIIFSYFLIKNKKKFLEYLINNKLKVFHFFSLFILYYFIFLKKIIMNNLNFFLFFQNLRTKKT